MASFAPNPRANAVLDKLCPYHYPYVSKCQNCRAFLHKVSRELFGQEEQKVKTQAEMANLMKKLAENQSIMNQKDLQIQVLSDKLNYQKNVNLVPGTEIEWMVHALASRLNKRLKVTPKLLENVELKNEGIDCTVDFEGFDKEKLAQDNATKTIVNDQCQTKLGTRKEPTFPKKQSTKYTPCGTESLFNETPTSVTASLGLVQNRGRRGQPYMRRGFHRYPRRGNFKRGNFRGNFNQSDMTRFLDDYFTYKRAPVETDNDNDNESIRSYTTEDQENSNIALPRGDKNTPPMKKVTTVTVPAVLQDQDQPAMDVNYENELLDDYEEETENQPTTSK